MKIRTGFVSNSSSSSFICQICSNRVEGMDSDDPCNVDMVRCQNGHLFCVDHVIDSSPVDLLTKKNLIISKADYYTLNSLDEYPEQTISALYYHFKFEHFVIPKSMCPVCSLQTVLDPERNAYILKKFMTSPTLIDEEIKSKFKTYNEFRTYLGTNSLTSTDETDPYGNY